MQHQSEDVYPPEVKAVSHTIYHPLVSVFVTLKSPIDTTVYHPLVVCYFCAAMHQL